MNNWISNYVNATKKKYQRDLLIPERTIAEGVDKAKAECQKNLDNRLKELSKEYHDQKNRIKEIPLNKEYLITTEPIKTTIKINESSYIIDKNIGLISKDELIKKINPITKGGTTHAEYANQLEKNGCKKTQQFIINENSITDRLQKLKNKQELEDNELKEVTIPGGKMSFKATNNNTIISKKNGEQNKEDLCAEFEKNIGLIKNEDFLVHNLWNPCETNLANKMGQSVQQVTKTEGVNNSGTDDNLEIDDMIAGGKYKKNSKLEKKKTFRYRIKRNKLGRFVKGKTRKSHL